MPTDFITDLPATLRDVRAIPLFVMRLTAARPTVIGQTPAAFRRVIIVTGGKFTGERLSGEVLDGGSDWQTVRPDGVITLDVNLVLKTTDGALITMTYGGMRHGPPDVLERMDRGEDVDASSYYFRTNPVFETASEQYAWINRILAIGIGHRRPDGPIYSVFEVM